MSLYYLNNLLPLPEREFVATDSDLSKSEIESLLKTLNEGVASQSVAIKDISLCITKINIHSNLKYNVTVRTKLSIEN